MLEKTLGVDPHRAAAEISTRARRASASIGSARGERLGRQAAPCRSCVPTDQTTGKVALFTTCYGNRNEPDLDEDLVAVFEHNDIPVTLIAQENCCGMPRLEFGDLEQVARLKDFNVPHLKQAIDAGYDIVAPIPSCVLMFKQELRLMFPDDADVQQIAKRIFDPFEYLMLRHRAGLLKTDFKTSLGKVSYHVPCHLRVQNIGLKTRDVLKLVPDTTVDVIERCSGHNGTYGVKKKFPRRVHENRPAGDDAGGECEAGALHQRLPDGGPPDPERAEGAGEQEPEHPLKLLRIAYGL